MNDYVWYACYGSNLLEERFLCYIKGGKIPGNTRSETGARDKTPPVKSEAYILPYRLFFSYPASKWDGSGVAFLDHASFGEARTYARRYLITAEQFTDVIRQENSLREYTEISWDKDALIKEHSQVILPDDLYGRLLYVGDDEGFPVYSFTSIPEGKDMKPQRLFGAYREVIAAGLKETWNLTDEEIDRYLSPFE